MLEATQQGFAFPHVITARSLPRPCAPRGCCMGDAARGAREAFRAEGIHNSQGKSLSFSGSCPNHSTTDAQTAAGNLLHPPSRGPAQPPVPSAAPGTTGALCLCAEELNEGVSSILTNLLSYTSRSARVQGTGTGVRKALDKSKLALLSVKRQPRRLQRFPLVPGPRHLPAAPWLRVAARAPGAG